MQSANEGHLYPLEKQFIFIHKPAVLIRFEEIESVEFQRYAGGQGSTRNFDLCVTLVNTPGDNNLSAKEYTFSGIDKTNYSALYSFLSGKKIRIKNIEGVGTEERPASGGASMYDEGEEMGESSEDDDYDDDNPSGSGGSSGSDSDSDSEDDDELGSVASDDSDLEEHRKSAGIPKKNSSSEVPKKTSKKKSKDSSSDDGSSKKKKGGSSKKRKESSSPSKKSSSAKSPKKKKKDPNAPKKPMSGKFRPWAMASAFKR